MTMLKFRRSIFKDRNDAASECKKKKRFSLLPRSLSIQFPPTTAIAKEDDRLSLPEFVPPLRRRESSENSDEYLHLGMQYHERGELEKATYYWRLSAENESPLGLFFYGIALRHGWGCKKNPEIAVRHLQKAAECAVYDLQMGIAKSTTVAKSELVLAIYELGVCFRHGWGVPKNLATATYYFEIAANLGDPDAQNDLAFCYAHGHGVKKDIYKAAMYYRMAERQGHGIVGNSWIWKEKYSVVDHADWDGYRKKTSR